MLDRFLSVFSIASRIPVKAKFAFDPSLIDFYLPVIGVCPALLGLLVSVALAVAGDIPGKQPLVAAVLILIVQYLCFNLFHLDGLMDTADAFLGSVSAEKRQIMLKDSRIGVYGFFAGFASLSLKLALLGAGLKLAFLSACLPGVLEKVFIVFAYPIVGRFSAVLIPCMIPPANPEGLGTLAKNSKTWRCIAGAIVGFLVWALAQYGAGFVFGSPLDGNFVIGSMITAGASLVLIGPLTAVFYARLYRQSIGGYTGDTLGAAVETGELLYLAALLFIM